MVRICAILFCVIATAATYANADAPTTRPAATVAVMTFDVQGGAGHEWLGRAMQEGLATGFQRISGFTGVIVAGLPPTDAAGAISLAKPANPDVVIFGSIQIVGEQIRVSGQIISANSGRLLGTLRSDGSERDLFNIEDILSARVERILTPPAPANRAASAGPAVAIDLVGPTMTPGVSKYFDGNLMAQITPAPKYRDDYDRYYYQTADTSAFASYCGGYWGAWGCGIGCYTWSGYPVEVTPVSGW